METLLLTESPADLNRAGEILKAGGLVAIPTETVYGLAANALDGAAVARIFTVKGRPADNPLIVHVADRAMVTPGIALVDGRAEALMGAFWPGPLTLVLPRGGCVPDITSAGLDSVGVRCPDHPAATAIIAAAGVPLAAPSANRSGSPSPTTARHCIDDLQGRVDAIVDGGHCRVGIESTVLSLAGDTPEVLRPGAVTAEEVSRVLGVPVRLSPSLFAPLGEGERAASPGMKYRHYAPGVHITLVRGELCKFRDYVLARPEHCGALVFEGEEDALGIPSLTYGRAGDPTSQAAALFEALREADGLGVERIYVRAPAAEGVGLGVYNRLLRAASFEVIDLG